MYKVPKINGQVISSPYRVLVADFGAGWSKPKNSLDSSYFTSNMRASKDERYVIDYSNSKPIPFLLA